MWAQLVITAVTFCSLYYSIYLNMLRHNYESSSLESPILSSEETN